MPTRFLHAQISMPSVSGSPNDTVVNTLAVITSPTWVGDATDLGAITIPLAQIWTKGIGTDQATGVFIGASVSRETFACRIKLYDVTNRLAGQPHGSPLAEDGFTMPAFNNGSRLPHECAIVARLRSAAAGTLPVETPDGTDANLLVDRPRQRQTGRLYFGPFSITGTVTPEGRPDGALRTRLANGIQDSARILSQAGHSLAIWSRANQAFYPAAFVHVDDAWDTIRKRGVKPTTGVNLALAPA